MSDPTDPAINLDIASALASATKPCQNENLNVVTATGITIIAGINEPYCF
jgi:urease beta subunit